MLKNWNKLTVVLLLCSSLFVACDKNKGFTEARLAPVAKMAMDQFFTTTTNEATIKAHLSNAERARSFIIDFGFLYSETPFEGFVGANKISLGSTFEGSGNFSTNLSPLTKRFYFVRAYVSYEDNENYFTELSVINTQPGKWEQKATFPGEPKIKATSFVINDKAYISGGQSDELWVYDPTTDSWTEKAPSPKPLDNPVSFVLDGKAYVGLNVHGIEQDRLPDFWSYDPERDQWKEVASPSEFLGSIVQNPVAFGMRGRGYIECNFNLMLEYNPISDQWSYAPPTSIFQFDRADAITICVGDSVVVVGGIDATDNYKEDVQIYTGRAKAWELKNDFPQDPLLGNELGRTSGLGFSINGEFYAGMGEAESRLSFGDIYVYNPQYDVWVANATIPAFDFANYGIQQGVGFSINNVGYVSLGRRSWRAGVEDFSEVNFYTWAFIAD